MIELPKLISEVECRKCSRCLPMTTEYFTKCKASSTGFTDTCKECRSVFRALKTHWMDYKLKCLKCLEYKDVLLFDSNQGNKHRSCRDFRCKECKKKQYERRREGYRGESNIDRLMLERYYGARERALKIGCDIDIDKNYLMSLWDKQNGRCAITALKMTFIFGKGRTNTNVSVDRIIPELGYVKGNIQLVCMIVNQMKSNLTMDELIFYCESILLNSIKIND